MKEWTVNNLTLTAKIELAFPCSINKRMVKNFKLRVSKLTRIPNAAIRYDDFLSRIAAAWWGWRCLQVPVVAGQRQIKKVSFGVEWMATKLFRTMGLLALWPVRTELCREAEDFVVGKWLLVRRAHAAIRIHKRIISLCVVLGFNCARLYLEVFPQWLQRRLDQVRLVGHSRRFAWTLLAVIRWLYQTILLLL